MKTLTALAVALLALAPALRAGDDSRLLLVAVKGTIATQVGDSTDTYRTHVEKYDNDRLYEEFGVSKDTYALVLSLLDNRGVYFHPRNPLSTLPDIPVFAFTNIVGSVDTKTKRYTVVYPTDCPTEGNSFGGASGTTFGSITFTGTLESRNFQKASLKYVGGIVNNLFSPVFRFSFKSTGQF